MVLSSLLAQMVKLFSVIIVGYILNKIGIMDSDFNKKLSHLVLNVTLPAMVLGSVLTSTVKHSLSELGVLVLGTALLYIVQLLAAFTVPSLIPAGKSERSVYRFVAMFGNTAFIGYPIIEAIWGIDAFFYAMLGNLPFNLFAFTLGVGLIAGGSKVEKNWKMFLNSGVISSLLAAVFALTDIAIPSFVGEVCELVGQITTPSALLIIGVFLADLPLKEVLGGVKIWIMAAVRLLAVPFVLLLILPHLISDPTIIGVVVVLGGMPCATNGLMFCLEYDGESKIMGQAIFLTTLLAILTIPFITSFLV
ncbi:MAG: AEC family transporter [Lachnospiraceae bacterium]|nr:AEC family transporter [Lachnospiraceae bacterium]